MARFRNYTNKLQEMKYYVSIHDVDPDNLDTIEKIIYLLQNKYKIKKICLLVIPGLDWKKDQVYKLKTWQNDDIELAAHGWVHKSEKHKSFYHFLHSLFMSRNCAEHLSKTKHMVIELMNNSYKWFADNRFVPPTLYVPPGWALGKIHVQDLFILPFTNYECTTGIYQDGKYRFLPLIGFEATTHFRAFFLRFFNYFNFQIAKFIGVVRITIHPRDFQLHLSKDINNYLSRADNTILLHELS